MTLKEHGVLRGCIGYTAPIKPLPLVVRDVAAYAALEDHRFPPGVTTELGQLEYEISVLLRCAGSRIRSRSKSGSTVC